MILSMFLPIVKIVVSSANINKSPLVIASERSLTKIENNLGPNIEPWGTPNVTVLDSDLYLVSRSEFYASCLWFLADFFSPKAEH